MRIPASLSHVSSISVGVCALLAVGALGCKERAPDDLIQQPVSTEALVFVKAAEEESLNRTRGESNLYKLSPISADGEVTPLTGFVGAGVSDPCVSFDGRMILFSLRPPGANSRNIWEIGVDGTGLRQVTRGGGDDFDPIYLPDGKILFTSNRDGEMDEYNHAPAEHMHICNADGGELERISFNQSDDFDPALMPNGRILYTRWEHFGTMNRFPLFATNPDGTGTFHSFGPHGRNFFHAQPTPDGRIIAIESTEIEGDAGPLALLKPEQGPADPADNGEHRHWDVLTTDVNTGGSPWPYGVFKYPFPIGDNRYVVSYSLPAATEEETDYALYTLTLDQTGSGTPEDPATLTVRNLTFLYNDSRTNEYDAQLIAPREKPPVIPSVVDHNRTTGVFLAQDVFNRGANDGQERPQRGADTIERIAVLASRPTMRGEMGDFSANEFEKRSLLGFAPVESDGSFRIEVPADTPISFATMDELDRGFVVKRTWLYVRPGEEFDKCVGCHEDRQLGEPVQTNPLPMARLRPATDLNVPPEARRVIAYENEIGPIVEAKCAGCHHPTYVQRDSLLADSTFVTVTDTIPPPGELDLTAVVDTTDMMDVFPRGYLSLSGEMEFEDGDEGRNVVVPAFARHSPLIDWILGVGERSGESPHPEAEFALTEEEKFLFKIWVLLGAQYR